MALVDDVERWLDTKDYQLWADWEICRPDRRRLAAQWFVDQLIDFAHFQPGRFQSDPSDLQRQQQEARRGD